MNKNCFSVDFVKHTISGSTFAFNKASKGYGDAYDELVRLTTQHPNFELVKVDPKKFKQTYKGLTLSLMRDYVSIQRNSDELLPLFNAVCDLGEARGNKVATAKHWLLETFKGITVEKMKEAVNAFYYAETLDGAKGEDKGTSPNAQMVA